jgi:hypothetical protein
MKHGTLTRSVLAALKRLNRGTVNEIAADLNLPRKPVAQALATILEANMSHVCDWQVGENGKTARVFRYGEGCNVTRWKAETLKEERTISREGFRHTIRKNFPNVGRCDIASSWIRSNT